MERGCRSFRQCPSQRNLLTGKLLSRCVSWLMV
ncbi:hypothetical protein I3843_07G067600 [Carya illinoinensis]|nr:hypothetical protein I3843_07G067600 [Carya illinoinensis]